MGDEELFGFKPIPIMFVEVEFGWIIFLWLFLGILGKELCEKNVFFVGAKDNVVSTMVVTLYIFFDI
jgi:hypothetical protein